MIIEKLQTKYFFAEDTTAGNEDAKLCLKKEGEGNWGACEDYEKYVLDLVQREKARKESNPDQAPLRIQSYFAESDIMIGKGGQKYFEHCWRQEGVDGSGVEFESIELPDTNHETSIVDLEKGALKLVFQEIKKAAG